MATRRNKKPSRVGTQQTNRYFHVLAPTLRLVNRKDSAIQENQTSNAQHGNSLTGGRRSTDRASFELYDRWLSLSPREQDVTYLTCLGYKNHHIAFKMGVSVRTVQSYLEHVYLKIGVRSKVDLRLKFHDFDFERNSHYK
jgi:DNA-binding NarL/FixJ family response regulator